LILAAVIYLKHGGQGVDVPGILEKAGTEIVHAAFLISLKTATEKIVAAPQGASGGFRKPVFQDPGSFGSAVRVYQGGNIGDAPRIIPGVLLIKFPGISKGSGTVSQPLFYSIGIEQILGRMAFPEQPVQKRPGFSPSLAAYRVPKS
jgi:hypothetical protein